MVLPNLEAFGQGVKEDRSWTDQRGVPKVAVCPCGGEPAKRLAKSRWIEPAIHGQGMAVGIAEELRRVSALWQLPRSAWTLPGTMAGCSSSTAKNPSSNRGRLKKLQSLVAPLSSATVIVILRLSILEACCIRNRTICKARTSQNPPGEPDLPAREAQGARQKQG